MSEEKIDSYVHRPSIADDTSFLTGQLKQVLELFDKVNATKVTLNGAKGMNEVVDAAKKAKAAVDDLASAKEKLNKTDATGTKTSLAEAKVKKELALASKAEAQARKENAAAALLEAKAADQAAKAGERDEKQKKATQKQLDDLANEYLQLSKAQRDAALKAKNYALTLGENHPVTVQAVKDAKAMHDILLRVDQSVGQSQRNVGNYKEAFNGLTVSFTHVARELPALAINTQTFLLAISNNLPMVQDEIRKARLEIAALRAEGKETPSLIQRLGASLINWQVGLSIAITLLTTLGPKLIEWAKGLFDSEVAAKKAAKAQQEYNKRIEEAIELNERYNKDIKRFGEDSVDRKLENDLLRARALGKSEKEILEIERAIALERAKNASQTFFSEVGEKSLEDLRANLDKTRGSMDELLKKTGITYSQFSKMFALQGFGIGKIEGLTDAEKERLEFLKQDFETQEKAYLRQKKVVEDYYNANRDLEIKDLELKKLAAEQRAKFFADELQYRADILKNISQLEDAERITRLNARKQALKNERAIIEGEYQDELFAAKDNLVKIFEATREYNFRKKKLAEEYERDVLAIRQTYLKRQQELLQQENQMFRDDDEKRIMQKEERERKAFETSKNYSEFDRDIKIKSYEAERNAKIKAAKGDKERFEIEREFNLKRAKAEIQANAEILNSALTVAEAKLKIAEQGTDKNLISELEAQIASLKRQLEELKGVEIDLNIDDAKAKLEKLKGDIQDVGNKILELFTAIGNIINANVDREKNAIQGQIDDIEERKEKEIEAINASALTQQEKADKIAILNARSAAQKEALERRQRQLDLQRARFEKAQAIAQAVLKTAVAVLEGLIKFGPAGAIAYGAIGAAQIATAIAAPLPKFKHGREDGPATFGIVGDGGKNEVIYSPDLKHAMVTPDTDTLAFIPKGYGVAPSVEDFQAMAMRMAHKELPVMPVIQQNNNDDLIYAMAHEIGSLKRAIMGKQETHFHWHDGELKKAIKKGNDWYRYVQNNI